MNCRWMNGVGVRLIVWGGVLLAVRAGAETTAPVAENPATKTEAVTNAATTVDNLKVAYLGEVRAKADYEAFAAKAQEEGYRSVAVLFVAAAASENIHLAKHAKEIVKLGAAVPVVDDLKRIPRSTKENLESALAGEIARRETIYPGFAKQAGAEMNTAVVYSFKGALAAGAEHAKFFRQALGDLNAWKEPGKSFAVCTVCGFTVMGKPPAICPVCSQPREKFTIYK